jgi:glycosyltransferase involved in cell wall biosynthesis
MNDEAAVIYHFFPHYRRPVMERLLASSRRRWVLYGDAASDAVEATIAPWVPADPARFVRTQLRRLPGGLLWQSGLLRLALGRRFSTLVFLADPHFPATWLAAALARLRGKRVLFWTHGWLRREGLAKRWMRRRFFALAHRLLLYGRGARRLGLAEGFAAERLHVIYNSLDQEAQALAQAGWEDADRLALREAYFPGDVDTPVVVCTTRLVRVRRLDLLLEAVALLARRGRRVNVLLVGDGPERPALAAQAAALGVRVHFAGACYDEVQLARYVACANCTVAPGKVGLTAMTSLGFGVPVLSHGDAEDQMPEWEAIVPGLTGDCFAPGDAQAIAEAIAHWTEAPLPTPEVRRACRAVIERFYNPENQVRLIEAAVDGRPAEAVVGERIQAEELR